MPPSPDALIVDPELTLDPMSRAIAQAILSGHRPRAGWAPDFPSSGDLRVSRHFLSTAPSTPSMSDAPWGAPLIVREHDVAVGGIGLAGPPKGGCIEVGYGIVPSAQGRRIATRSLARLLMSLDGLDLTVVAHTVPSNVASQRVLEHVGFTRVESEPGPDGSEMIAWHLVMSARSDQTVKGPKTR